MTEPDATAQSAPLMGRWRKVTTDPCAAAYPATLSFAAGTYRGERAPEQGMIQWDAGIYRLEGPRKLVVGTATDELVSYDIVIHADRFEFTDAAGCRTTYRRVQPQG